VVKCERCLSANMKRVVGESRGLRKVEGAGLMKKDIHLIKNGVSKGYVKPEGDLIVDKMKYYNR